MDGSRFDQAAKSMAAGSNRRSLLKALGGGAIAALGLVRVGGGVDLAQAIPVASADARFRTLLDTRCP
jgi:hypothetical protein